jgi:hypothetical protein
MIMRRPESLPDKILHPHAAKIFLNKHRESALRRISRHSTGFLSFIRIAHK